MKIDAYKVQSVTDSLSIIQHFIDNKADPVSQINEIYQSSIGDLWQLVREASPKQCLVRHTSTSSARGVVSEMSIERFLAINGSGPKREALRLLFAKTEVVT